MPGPGDFNISNVSAFGNTSVLFSSTPIKRHLNSSSKSGDEVMITFIRATMFLIHLFVLFIP